MLKVIVDDKIPYLEGVLEPYAEVEYIPGRQITNHVIRNADALVIRTRTKCDETLLKSTPVKFIATATIGFDHIDADYCSVNNIIWTNAPGCNSSSVMQYVTAALLKLERDRQMTLKGSTIGVVGVGNVGSKVAEAAGILGMRVLLNDPPRERREGSGRFVPIEEILKESDVITLHVPLNMSGDERTYHLVDDETLGMIKEGSWLINTSRGEVADNPALKRGLQSGRLAGIILDVWENEPDIDRELMRQVFIATPHIAGYSADGKANGTSMSVNALSKFFNLPLTDWYPDNVPAPAEPVIALAGNGNTVEDIIAEAVSHTYRIEDDDRRLRASPSEFERLRGSYPLRREFDSYSLRLAGGSAESVAILERLGFRILE
jgi:erythronate-4-phosphate dehydrogenase